MKSNAKNYIHNFLFYAIYSKARGEREREKERKNDIDRYLSKFHGYPKLKRACKQVYGLVKGHDIELNIM